MAFKAVARLRRHEADRARRGVAPEQRALRTAQHLHALKIEEGGAELRTASAIDAVEIDRHLMVEGPIVRARPEAAAEHDRVHARIEQGKVRNIAIDRAQIGADRKRAGKGMSE